MTKTAKNILELAARLSLPEINKLREELALLARNRARAPRFASEEELKAELDRRIDQAEAHPERLVPAKQALREIRARLHLGRKSGTRG